MAARKRYMATHLDHFRTLLVQEPRGHRDMFGAVLTPPTTQRGQYGLLFMDNAGYLDMCGHGVISVTTALIETGMIPPTEPETTVVFDTPAGVVESHARVEQQQVIEVSVADVPAFLYAKDVELDLPEQRKYYWYPFYGPVTSASAPGPGLCRRSRFYRRGLYHRPATVRRRPQRPSQIRLHGAWHTGNIQMILFTMRRCMSQPQRFL
jgi:hypothetical protein